MEMLTPFIPLFKVIHIVGFTAWFAGMFYLVRIFVYHEEAFDKAEPERSILIKQYNVMEWRVYNIICKKGLEITWIFGLLMVAAYGLDWLKVQPWLHIKLVLVFALSWYSTYNRRIIERLEKGERVMTSTQFRLYNEVPSIFLLTVVLLAVYKNGLNYLYALIGIVVFIVTLIVFTKIYKKIRERNSQS